MSYTKDQIKQLLLKSDKAVLRGLAVIYGRQTRDEQDSEFTKHNNGIGFSGFDANFLTSLAKQVEQRGYLTPKQMVYARKRMLRYAGQLAKVANEKAPAEQPAPEQSAPEQRVNHQTMAPLSW